MFWNGSAGNQTDYHCLVKWKAKHPVDMAAGLDKTTIDKLIADKLLDHTVVDVTANNDWLINQCCLINIATLSIIGLLIVCAPIMFAEFKNDNKYSDSPKFGMSFYFVGCITGCGICNTSIWSMVILIMVIISRWSPGGRTCAGDYLTDKYGPDLAQFPKQQQDLYEVDEGQIWLLV